MNQKLLQAGIGLVNIPFKLHIETSKMRNHKEFNEILRLAARWRLHGLYLTRYDFADIVG